MEKTTKGTAPETEVYGVYGKKGAKRYLIVILILAIFALVLGQLLGTNTPVPENIRGLKGQIIESLSDRHPHVTWYEIECPVHMNPQMTDNEFIVEVHDKFHCTYTPGATREIPQPYDSITHPLDVEVISTDMDFKFFGVGRASKTETTYIIETTILEPPVDKP